MISPRRPALLLLPLILFASSSAVSAEEAKPATSPPAAAAQPSDAAPAPLSDAAPAPPAGAAEATGLKPEQVVANYLKAMQEHRFPDAYPYVSSTLRAGKSVEEWAKEQQYVMQMGEVKIIEYKVYPAIIGKDNIARVPNVLKSQDKFLNQLGLDEHELYELIKEGGAWRIDQQTLVEGADRAEYFPEDGGKK